MFQKLMSLAELGDDRFEAPASADNGDTVFGGQFIAQCMVAAAPTLADDRRVNSLHAYFLRPGDVDLPLDISVDAVRDGRSFSWRQVVAKQRGKELFRLLLSYQVPDESPEYTRPAMPSVPPPEDISFTYNDFIAQTTGESSDDDSAWPVESRYINPPKATPGEPVTDSQLMWMRIGERLPDTPALHQAGLAYLSDASLIDQVLMPHGLRWQDANFVGTSLDHAMWFHRFARADDWLLFEQTAEATGGGRGLARGYFFDRSGRLVATCMQEGLMRWMPGGAK